MNRTVVSGLAAFALLIGATLALTETTVQAGHCGGGLFAKLQARGGNCGGGLFGGHGLLKGGCGGGLLAKLHARHAAPDCCEPAPVACCEPAPEPCCEPAPVACCEPAPEPCCAPAPVACCEPAPACGGCEVAAPVAAAPCCGGEVMHGGDAGYDLAPGESLVPGSVSTLDGTAVETPSSSDAPPAPVADAKTDI